MSKRRRWWCAAPLLAVALGSTACEQQMQDDDGLPGTSLGTYQVHATLEESTCGPGAFGSPDAWDFEVKLARDGAVAYWNNGSELVEGTMSEDGRAFSFTAQMLIPVTERKGAQPECVIVRQDTANGTLAGDSPEATTGFTGQLAYGFDQQTGSDCAALVEQAGATSLPCSMRYGTSATRTE